MQDAETDVNSAVAPTSKCDFSTPREVELRRPSPYEWSKFEKLGRLLPSAILSYLGRPFLTSSPEDEKCIKHYRHSVSCGGQHPPIERLSSYRSRFPTRLACASIPFCHRVYEKRPWKMNRITICSLPSSLLVRLRWDLSCPLPYCARRYWPSHWSLSCS